MTQYSTEVEFKFFPQDVNQVLENLKSMAEIKQERTLLRAVCCRRENNAGFQDMDIIRVRDEGDKVRLTMKQRYQ